MIATGSISAPSLRRMRGCSTSGAQFHARLVRKTTCSTRPKVGSRPSTKRSHDPPVRARRTDPGPMHESPPAKSLTPAERRQRLADLFPVWNKATLSQFFDAMADRYPQRPLILCDDRAYSYREIMQWSRRLASGLVACGVRNGSHVALILGNFPEFVAVKLAIARIGATAVPVNFLLRRGELQYILEQSDSVALITMSALRDLDYLEELDAIVPGWERRAGGEALPKMRHVFVYP